MLKVLTMKRNLKGSITVEACLVLPIFIYAIVAFLYFIQIMLVQECIQSALTETGKYASQYAFVHEYVKNYETPNGSHEELSITQDNNNIMKEYSATQIIDTAFYQVKMRDFIEEAIINHSCIVGGINGIHLGQSSFLKQNDIIDISAYYIMKIPIGFLGIDGIPLAQAIKLRAFTGYKPNDYREDPNDDNEDPNDKIVYITRTGTVYHLSKECTHIKLNISQCIYSQISNKRNENGEKYKACEKCIRRKRSDNSQTIYITSDGDRYHNTLTCPGLKRSVIEILLSRVKGRSLCTRCSKKVN